MPGLVRGPCTCQGSGPGWGGAACVWELPAHLHVLINHKMSPGGRIKLSLDDILSPPHTMGSSSLHSPLGLGPGLPTHPCPWLQGVSVRVKAGAQKGKEKEKLQESEQISRIFP